MYICDDGVERRVVAEFSWAFLCRLAHCMAPRVHRHHRACRHPVCRRCCRLVPITSGGGGGGGDGGVGQRR